MKFDAAINQLKNSLYQVRTNEPINRREGKIEQAELEKTNAKSFEAAIRFLGKADRPKTGLWK